MRNIVGLFFIAGLIVVICAHPADKAAAAVSSAAANATSDAKAAKDSASNATDLLKKADPTKAMAVMAKEAKDLNPTNVAALASKFMATISEACEKFIQGVFKSFSPSPSAIPGLGEVSKMTNLFNPLEVGKDVVDDVLNIFGGAPLKPPKDVKDAAKDAKKKAANDTDAAADKADAAKDKAKPDEGKDIVTNVEDMEKDMMGGIFKSFGF